MIPDVDTCPGMSDHDILTFITSSLVPTGLQGHIVRYTCLTEQIWMVYENMLMLLVMSSC